MSDNKELVLIGYSGHGFVVADAALTAGLPLFYYTDKQEVAINPFNLAYLGCEDDESFLGWGKGNLFILGIGDNKLRQKIAANIGDRNEFLANVIHPDTSISTKVELGTGVFISRKVAINANVSIGDNVILNTGCIVEHGCKIANSAHIAPGAILAGDVEVGERTFIGAGAIVKQGLKIGMDVVVGAGAIVLNNLSSGHTYVGNPAKLIK